MFVVFVVILLLIGKGVEALRGEGLDLGIFAWISDSSSDCVLSRGTLGRALTCERERVREIE